MIFVFQKQREKGRILLKQVKWVEKADLGGEPPPLPNENYKTRPRPFGCIKLSSQFSNNNQNSNHNRLDAGFQV